MEIVITAVVTFSIVAIWNHLATKKLRQTWQFMTTAMWRDMDEMARQLGHEDLRSYYVAAKDEQYASNVMENLRGLVRSFSDRGAD